MSWDAGRESGATKRAECTRGAGRRPRARAACVQTRSVCESTSPPEADEDTSNGANRTLRPGRARAPGQSIDVAAPMAQRRENGTPSAASWERAHRVFCPKRRRRPQSGPPARAKKSGGISALERTARPLTWVRASPAWPRAVASRTRAADAGRLSSWQRPTGERRGLSHKLIEPGTLRALTNAEIYKRTGQIALPARNASRPAAPHANVPAFAPSTAPITSTPSPIPFLTSAASSLFCFASPLTHPLPRSHHPGLAPQFYWGVEEGESGA